MSQNASRYDPSYNPVFNFNPQPEGYGDVSPDQQAAAATTAFETLRGQARAAEAERLDNHDLAAAGIGVAGAAAGMGAGALARTMSRSGNRWLRGAGALTRVLQAGPGNFSRWTANKWGLTRPAQTLANQAEYVAARRPGAWAAAARLPMHVLPDPSIPYAANFGNSLPGRFAAGAVNSGPAKLLANAALGSAATGGTFYYAKNTADSYDDYWNKLNGAPADVASLLTGGADQVITSAMSGRHNIRFRRDNEAKLSEDYDSEKFDRLYRDNLRDMRILNKREESQRQAAQSLIGLLLGGIFGGLPGAGAGAGLPYLLGQLADQYKSQGTPWSGQITAKGYAAPGTAESIRVGADTFDRLRQLADNKEPRS